MELNIYNYYMKLHYILFLEYYLFFTLQNLRM